MSASREALVNPQRRLPELTLPTLGGAERRLRPPERRAPVLLLIHGPECEGCLAGLRTFADAADALAEWDGRLLAISPAQGPPGAAAVDILVDAEGRVAAACDVAVPALVVADSWGEIHLAETAGADHAWPAVEEVVGWLQYLATRCPECEGEAL